MIYEKSEILGLHLPQVIRVKARRIKICDSKIEFRKFNFSAKAISFDNLRSILARIFDISGEFTVNYLSRKYGLLPITSDLDLDGALLQSRNFSLKLEVHPLPIDKGLEEWDIICPADIPPTECLFKSSSLTGSIISQVGRKMQRAFSLEKSCEFLEPDRMPLGPAEIENFLDSEGRISRPRDLHIAVYQGGVEPSLRPEVWKHLLNVFPNGLTWEEREVYLNEKSKEYYQMRDNWERLHRNGMDVPDVLKNVTNLVTKDVRRTDRSQKFFSGSDDNKNTQSLFNILTTYAVNHQSVSYCQGMSDILSPILYVMKDEAEAYVCFCGLMQRISENFRPDGRSMRRKFRHLRQMLLFYNRDMFLHFKRHDALGLIFCYRWLVLELKREFAYDDALHVLEVMWGSLPPKSPEKEISLYETLFPPQSKSGLVSDGLLHNGLSWDENHFGRSIFVTSTTSLSDESTSVKPPNLPLKRYSNVVWAGKWAARARREYQIRSRYENSVDDEEGEATVLRNNARSRSIWNKRARSSVSFPGATLDDPTSIIEYKNNENFQSECTRSWAYGEEPIPQLVITNDSDTTQSNANNQWCYANTIKELQMKNINCEEPQHNSNPKEAGAVNDNDNRHRHGSSDSNYSTYSEDYSDDDCRSKASKARSTTSTPRSKSEGYVSDTASATIDFDSDDDDDEYDDLNYGLMDSMFGRPSDEAFSYFRRRQQLLPPPHILGDGNPFLLFLCLSMILQQQDAILKKRLDYNELGMFFDKLVRKHKTMTVVCKARSLFGQYLNMGWNENLSESEDEFDV